MHDLNTLKKMFDQFHEAIYIVNSDRKILYFNPVAEKLSGFSRSEMEHTFCYENKLNHIDENGKQLCLEGCPLVASILHNRIEDHNVYMHHKDGHRVAVHVRTIPHLDQNGNVDGAIEVFSEVSNKNLVLEELKIREALAYIDPVTATFNRHYLNNEMPDIFRINMQKIVGIAFLDINDFKSFNDNFGHDIGDAVLQGVSKSITLNLPNQDALVRYGGDEFVLVLFGQTSKEIHATVNKINMLLQATVIRKDEQEYKVSTSIGLTFKAEQETVSNAIKRADEAMYIAKKNRDGKVVIL